MTDTIEAPAEAKSIDWREVQIHFGKQDGTALGKLSPKSLKWWTENWVPSVRFCSEKDKALRVALDLALVEPVVVKEKPDLTGNHIGTIGEKIQINQATVESIREYETEFNRKKVITTCLWLRNDNLFRWSTSSVPPHIKEGEVLNLTATVKDHRVNEESGERFTVLKLCKVVGAVKVEKPTHQLTLFCDAKASANGFAFCDAGGCILEYGKIRDQVVDFWPGYNGEQSNAEVCAALLAFDFARKVKEAAGLDRMLLNFHFDAQWMQGMVGKARPLRDFAKLHGLVVKMHWIPGSDNPADEWTTAAGCRVVSGNLAELAVPT